MANPFDQFDVKETGGNPFDRFDGEKPRGGAGGSFEKPAALKEFGKAAVSDVKDISKSIYQSVRHPIQTVKGVGMLTSGMLETIFPGPVDIETPEKTAFKQAIKPIVDSVKDPSEIPSRFLEYSEKHPLKTVFDLSIGLGGLGKLAEVGGLAKTAESLSEVSRISNPLTSVGKAAGWAVGKPIEAMKSGASTPQKALGKKYKIPTSVSEDLGNVAGQKLETLLEKVPLIGLKKFRMKQLAASDAAAKSFLSEYIAPGSTGLQNATVANRYYVSRLYENMKSVAQQIKSDIKPDNTKSQAIDLLDRYPDIFKKFQDTKLESAINNIVSSTKDVKKTSPILGPSGNPIVTITPKVATFDEMWTLRDGLGDMIGKAKKKLASGDVDRTEIAQLNSLFKAVNKDIDIWANSSSSPQLRTLINSANDAYKTYVVKYRLIQEAYDKAVGTVGAGEMFSPKKFSTSLKRIAYRDREFKTFKPHEIEEMTGLANIMQVVKRAGQFAENPPTGNRMLDFAMTGGMGGGAVAGMITNPVGTIVVGGSYISTTSLLRFLTTSETGKSMLITLSRVPPNSKTMDIMVNKVANQMVKLGYMADQAQ